MVLLMRNINFLFFLMIFSLPVYAQEGYLCAKTYRYIDLGNTLAEVQAACGKPIRTSTEQRAKTVTEPTEEWVYYGVEDPDDRESWHSQSVSVPADFDIYLYRLPKLYVTFRRNKVISVTLDSQEVGSSNICDRAALIKKGDDQSTVEGYCGSPRLSNAGSKTFYEGLVEVTTWVYQFDEYQPPLILEFQGGKLSRIKSQ